MVCTDSNTLANRGGSSAGTGANLGKVMLSVDRGTTFTKIEMNAVETESNTNYKGAFVIDHHSAAVSFASFTAYLLSSSFLPLSNHSFA